MSLGSVKFGCPYCGGSFYLTSKGGKPTGKVVKKKKKRRFVFPPHNRMSGIPCTGSLKSPPVEQVKEVRKRQVMDEGCWE